MLDVLENPQDACEMRGRGWPKHPRIQNRNETTAFDVSLDVAFDVALDLGAIAEHKVFTASLKVPITF